MKIFDRFRHKSKWDCSQVVEHLSEYLHDGLSTQQRDAVQHHLISCDTCRSELNATQEIEAALRLEAFRHQPQISKSVSARIRQNVYQTLRRGILIQQTFKFLRLVFVATVMLLLAIKGDRLLRQSSIRPQPAAHPPKTTATPSAVKTQLPTPVPANENIVVISTAWEKDQWQRNFNPFSFNGHSFAVACLYEPLMLQNDVTGEVIPWLATGYAWNDDNTLLSFHLRQGVRWSDGEDLLADDVVATFTLLRDHPEITGFPEYPHPVTTLFATDITDVSAPDNYTVQFRFRNINIGALATLIHTPIIPRHQWENIKNPAEFANENPIGSGPFTTITVFETRQNGMERTVQFERNPYYWQAEKISIQGVRYSVQHEAYAIKSLQNGLVDWAMLDLSNPKKDFVALAPDSFHASIMGGSTTMLYLNTSRSPFSHVIVRQAISMSINRQAILGLMTGGKTGPANANGISPFERSRWNDNVAASGYWMEYDPQMANNILDEMGFIRGVDGIRIGPNGTPMRFVYHVSNPSDRLETDPTTQIIYLLANDLHAIGIELTIVEIDADQLWKEISNDDFDMLILDEGAGAYWLYHSVLSSTGYSIYGSDKTNAEAKRYFNDAAQSLLDALANTTDINLQSETMNKLQAIFVKDTPALPLYSTAYYYQYNTSRFTGFPNDENRYETGINIGWDTLPVFVRLKPKE